MKNLKIVVITLAFLLVGVSNVNATDIDYSAIDDETVLMDCFSENNTCVLSENIDTTSMISINKNVVLDLNGKRISFSRITIESGASLTIKNGEIDSKISLNDSSMIELNDVELTDYISGKGNIIVNGGIISSISTQDGSSLVVNKGEISSISIGNGTNAIIDGGKINSITIAKGANVAIHDGNISYLSVFEGANLSIDGGLFKANIGDKYLALGYVLNALENSDYSYIVEKKSEAAETPSTENKDKDKEEKKDETSASIIEKKDEEVNETPVPKTYDSIIIYQVLGLISIMGLTGTILFFKKKKINN